MENDLTHMETPVLSIEGDRHGPRIKTIWKRLLDGAFQLGASDIHIRSDAPPVYRIGGNLRTVDVPPLTSAEVEQLCEALSQRRLAELHHERHAEFGCTWGERGRFRAHYYQAQGVPGLALRVIPRSIPSMQDLRLPSVCKRLCAERSGLILVTGATGMGKSTTLAALIHTIATTSSRRIVTIEDPVEYVLPDGSSCVTQCEVGSDVQTFEDGLHMALRLDPDVLLIGEIRTPETMDVAMRAAISGHLLLAAVHFQDAIQTVNGVVGMAPPVEQQNWRLRLAEVLRATISQRLIPRRGSDQRILATEVMLNEPSIAACIEDPSKTRSLRAVIARGRATLGSHTIDQSLLDLLEAQQITIDTAKSAAASPAELTREINLRRIAT